MRPSGHQGQIAAHKPGKGSEVRITSPAPPWQSPCAAGRLAWNEGMTAIINETAQRHRQHEGRGDEGRIEEETLASPADPATSGRRWFSGILPDRHRYDCQSEGRPCQGDDTATLSVSFSGWFSGLSHTPQLVGTVNLCSTASRFPACVGVSYRRTLADYAGHWPSNCGMVVDDGLPDLRGRRYADWRHR